MKNWNIKFNDEYFFVVTYIDKFEIRKKIFTGDLIDRSRHYFGNMFATLEDAEAHIETIIHYSI